MLQEKLMPGNGVCFKANDTDVASGLYSMLDRELSGAKSYQRLAPPTPGGHPGTGLYGNQDAELAGAAGEELASSDQYKHYEHNEKNQA